MRIIEEYSRQYTWRSWPQVFAAIPEIRNQFVIDLGCGIGDQAADLCSRGAHVIGLDINKDFIAYANARQIANAEFRVTDLRSIHLPNVQADGIWSSFTTAYFPLLDGIIAGWVELLKPGGWIVLVEIDALFKHHPISTRSSELLDMYVDDSLKNQRYDFCMGGKIPTILRRMNFEILANFSLPDTELSFNGPAPHEIQEAWRLRFDRMQILHQFCGVEFENVRDDFLNCLTREDHRSEAMVKCCIARKSNV